MKSACTPFSVLRDSFTIETLATSAHGSWCVWTMYRGHKLPMIFSYRKLPPWPCAICLWSDDSWPYAKLFRKQSLTDPGHLCPTPSWPLFLTLWKPALYQLCTVIMAPFYSLEPNSGPLTDHSAGGRASLLLNPLSDVTVLEEVSVLPAPLATRRVSWEQLSEH